MEYGTERIDDLEKAVNFKESILYTMKYCETATEEMEEAALQREIVDLERQLVGEKRIANKRAMEKGRRNLPYPEIVRRKGAESETRSEVCSLL